MQRRGGSSDRSHPGRAARRFFTIVAWPGRHKVRPMKTNRNLSLVLLITSLVSPSFAAEPALKLQSRPALTLALAQKMAAACVKHQAESKSPPMAIAIYDAGANLIYYMGMDGVSPGTGPTAMAKGESSARFRTPTAQIGGWVQGSPAVGKEYDGALHIAVPGNTSRQRLVQSGRAHQS